MVEKPDIVAELAELQSTGHNHNVLATEFNGTTDNVMHVINHLNHKNSILMKKRNLTNLKLNKKSISNLSHCLKGGFIDSLNAPCEERDTYNTHCPDLSKFRNNC